MRALKGFLLVSPDRCLSLRQMLQHNFTKMTCTTRPLIVASDQLLHVPLQDELCHAILFDKSAWVSGPRLEDMLD